MRLCEAIVIVVAERERREEGRKFVEVDGLYFCAPGERSGGGFAIQQSPGKGRGRGLM